MLDTTVRELESTKAFAAVTTLLPDGQPQAQITCVGATDDQLLVKSEVRRQKVRGNEALPHLGDLTQKGQGTPYPNPIGTERVILHTTPARRLSR